MAGPKTRKEHETEVRSWGFTDVFTWTDGPYVATIPIRACHSCSRAKAQDLHSDSNAHYSPHTHDNLTTHLILEGELTITYPKDETPTKQTFGVGDRIDVGAGRVHEVWVGKDGCTYVIGE